jgi:hypothetical protein
METRCIPQVFDWMDLFVYLTCTTGPSVRSTFHNNTTSTFRWSSSVANRLILLMLGSLSVTLLLASITYSASLTGVRYQWVDPYSLRPNPLYLYARSLPSRPPGNTPIYGSRFRKDSDVSPSRTRPFRLERRQDTSETVPQELDTRPTPQPTGEPSVLTTVFINSEKDFALLLPRPGGTFASSFNLCTPPTPY